MDASKFWTELTIRLGKDAGLRADVRRYLDELYPLAAKPDARRPTPKARPTADDLIAEIEEWERDKVEAVERAARERLRQRKASPKVSDYVPKVPELRHVSGLNSWAALADHLRIEVGGDSARRRVAAWVAANKPKWPPVGEPLK